MRASMCAMVFFLSLTLGCISIVRYRVMQNEPAAPPSFASYKNIQVGWLDFDEEKWNFYGYDTKDIWKTVSRDMNIEGLHVFLKDMLKDRTVTGAASKAAGMPKSGDLYVSFTKTDDVRSYILTTVTFTDIKSGKKLYSARVEAKQPKGFVTNFEMTLTDETRSLAGFVAETINRK